MYAFNFFYLPYDDLFCLLYVPVTSLSFYMAFFCFLCMTNEYIIIWHTIYDKKNYVKILYYNNDIILNNSGIRQFKAKTISYIIFSNIVPSHKASTTSYDQSFSPNQFVFLRTKRGLFVWFFNAAFFCTMANARDGNKARAKRHNIKRHRSINRESRVSKGTHRFRSGNPSIDRCESSFVSSQNLPE